MKPYGCFNEYSTRYRLSKGGCDVYGSLAWLDWPHINCRRHDTKMRIRRTARRRARRFNVLNKDSIYEI